MKIAVPIMAGSMDEALRDMDDAEKVADILELRIDCMQKPDLEKLLNHSQLPKIVTNRVKREGGKFEGTEDRRIASLREAISLGAQYVDIELSHYQPLERGSTKLIVSHHDFEQTPLNLAEIYRRILEKNPDIVKIATVAKNVRDSLRMLYFIAGADKDIIGICMGQHGMITRVFGPAFGGYLTFASLTREKSSAPGQMTAEDLRKIWEIFESTNSCPESL